VSGVRSSIVRICATFLLAVAIGGGLAGRALAAARVDIDRATATAPLPDGFLGLALEYSTIPTWVGSTTTSGGVNPVLVQLIRNLNPVGRPVIRIGGQSTDRSWWPVPHVREPAGVTYALGPTWAQSARLLAERLNARYVLSVNLEADSPQISSYEADKLLAGVGSHYVSYFEIGNEPDLYTRTPWYRVYKGKEVPWYVRAGTPHFARTAGYDESEYLSEFANTLAVMPDVPIAGPDADDAHWLGPFSELLDHTNRIGLLDSHAYALFNCQHDPSSSLYPSIPHLLSPVAVSRVLNGAAPFVTLAHRDGLQFRIDEMGSVSCDGRAGVSDTMAAALWVTDALFVAAHGGVNGVNLHSFPSSDNGLFDFTPTASGFTAQVHPIYYGALMFAQADPEGSRLLQIPTTTPSSLHVWGTIGADHHVRVLVINDGASQQVTIHAPRGYGSRAGSVEVLRGPDGAASQSGITLGGQGFGASTTTGTLPAATPQSLSPTSAGYTLTAPADSETLLTLRYRLKPAKTPAKK
jgi:hypothetical protein